MIDIPKIGQGTWNMEKNPKDSQAALRLGIELGLNHIDTAEMYGSGEVERIVGSAIEGQREKIFLGSKVLPSNADYTGTLTACERSLKNLQTDVLDLYLLHWRGEVPLEETFRAFESLQKQGKIRAYGVSNFDVSDLEEAIAIVGEKKIACNQVLYHLKERTVEKTVIPWCVSHGIPVVAYSPFGAGGFPKSSELETVAKKLGATPRQVALQFLLRHEKICAIPKASKADHVREMAGASKVHLSADDIAVIDRAFPFKVKQRLPTI